MRYPLVQAESLEFSGRTKHGFLIGPKGLGGLANGVAMRRDSVERALAHGSFQLKGYLDSRVMNLSGWILARNDEDLELLSRRLTGLGADGGTFNVSADHHGMRLRGVAQLASAVRIDESAGDSAAEYQAQWEFPNPRLFGEWRKFGPAAAVTVNHRGNFEAAPIITVTGSRPEGYTVTGSRGRRFVVTAPLVAGAPHTIDMSNGRLLVNGSPYFGGVSLRQLWTVPAGGLVTHSISAGAALTVHLRDTYV